MKEKTGKDRQRAMNYLNIERQRKEFAGQDCLTVVADNTVHAIGYEQEYSTCLDFIIYAMANDLDEFIKHSGFVSAEDCYKYLFENCNDEYELRNFLMDYWDGIDMNEY